jgi:hypothetical protein
MGKKNGFERKIEKDACSICKGPYPTTEQQQGAKDRVYFTIRRRYTKIKEQKISDIIKNVFEKWEKRRQKQIPCTDQAKVNSSPITEKQPRSYRMNHTDKEVVKKSDKWPRASDNPSQRKTSSYRMNHARKNVVEKSDRWPRASDNPSQRKTTSRGAENLFFELSECDKQMFSGEDLEFIKSIVRHLDI